MKKILIRADDLGYSRAVNYGIYDSVHCGNGKYEEYRNGTRTIEK